MDHIIIIIDKWRLHAIFSDPRVWINRGSKADQHGSTWINRLQHAARHGSCVMAHASGVQRVRLMRPASWLMRPASWLMRQTHASSVMAHASDSWLMRPASGVRRPASGVPRPTSHVPRPSFSDRRPLSVMTTTGAAAFPQALLPSDLRLLSCTA